ncbi:LysR family transcriptional regulator [Vreelandella olivaria]|uniref:LysR family transcriptional regulator n=1 Tax=Vreelandella olivaria TaxID=390919 RepID=UPI0030EEFE2D
MPELTLDLRYLKYAVHATEAVSFRRAAERLSIVQSTISRLVQMLAIWLHHPGTAERSNIGDAS